LLAETTIVTPCETALRVNYVSSFLLATTMILESDSAVLYIEPSGAPSDEPVDDDITMRFQAVYERSTCSDTEKRGHVGRRTGAFSAGVATKGSHVCTGAGCTVRSSNTDRMLINGIATNTLALHYLRYHRTEIPQHDLNMLSKHF